VGTAGKHGRQADQARSLLAEFRQQHGPPFLKGGELNPELFQLAVDPCPGWHSRPACSPLPAEERSRENRAGVPTSEDDVSWAIHGTSNPWTGLGLLTIGTDWRDRSYRLAETGKAIALEVLRARAMGPRTIHGRDVVRMPTGRERRNGEGRPTARSPATAGLIDLASAAVTLNRMNRDEAEWHSLLLERLAGSEAEDRLDRLAGHPALGGPELTFVQARLAQLRGDTDAARTLTEACLGRLPGHDGFADFAMQIGAKLPASTRDKLAERARRPAATAPG
jgi:hypothetical protein